MNTPNAMETDTREFKKSLAELKQGLVSLAAMLNIHPSYVTKLCTNHRHRVVTQRTAQAVAILVIDVLQLVAAARHLALADRLLDQIPPQAETPILEQEGRSLVVDQ